MTEEKAQRDPQQRMCVLLMVCILVFFIGCEQSPFTPPHRIERSGLDLSPLRGRKIVIDPGHGGRYPGALGVRKLQESDINLAVGLHLWGLLMQAGAQVWLTRTADVDLSPKHGDLKEDLNARARLSAEVNADIFISIHHNSNIYDRKKNNVQIYYKLIDAGPSEDLAGCLARGLGKDVSKGEIFVLPGNYRVLRNSQTTAVLGEASFISHKDNEERLSLTNQVRREAEDYFAGILCYFQKGIPQVVDLSPRETLVNEGFPRVKARLIGGEGGAAIDPKAAAIYLDGKLVPARFDPHTGEICHIPSSPLRTGTHTFLVTARNFNGNAARPARAAFNVSLPLERLEISSFFPRLPPGEQVCTRIEVRAIDQYGNLMGEDLLVYLTASGGRLSEDAIVTRQGIGIAYFSPPDSAERVELSARSADTVGTTWVTRGLTDRGLAKLAITDAGKQGISDVLVKADGKVVAASDQHGFAFFSAEKSGAALITVEKQGYAPVKKTIVFEDSGFHEEQLTMVPREGGILLGQRFTLDPEPWDERLAKAYGLERQYEGANLVVALHLQDLLETAGAKVVLTRSSLDSVPTLKARILRGEEFGSDFYLSLTHRNGNPSVTYYFASPVGQGLAQVIGGMLQEKRRFKELVVAEGTEFTIIQPSAPSVVVNLGDAMNAQNQEGLRQEAHDIYNGIVAFLSEQRK